MDLKTLKEGDKFYMQYGLNIRKVKVIKNFPKKEKIYLRIYFGLWGLLDENIIFSYSNYNFNLAYK
jgi:hypothetical protein